MIFKKKKHNSFKAAYSTNEFQLMLKATMLISHRIEELTKEVRNLSVLISNNHSQEEFH
jgi:hypothetical protein